MPASHPIARFGDERLPTRFWAKVFPMEDGCWIWSRYMDVDGYGHCTINKEVWAVHRLAYSCLVGPIREETIDHLCKTRLCVNPSHMEPVPSSVNSLRGNGPLAMNARKSSCLRGHPFSEENTMKTIRNGKSGRACRECGRVRHRAWYYRGKEKSHV